MPHATCLGCSSLALPLPHPRASEPQAEPKMQTPPAKGRPGRLQRGSELKDSWGGPRNPRGFLAEVAPSLAQDRRAWAFLPRGKWARTALGTRVSYPLLGPTPSEDLGQEPGCQPQFLHQEKTWGCCQEQTLLSVVALRLNLRRVSAPARDDLCCLFLTASAKDTSKPERGTRRRPCLSAPLPGRAGQSQCLSDVTARST